MQNNKPLFGYLEATIKECGNYPRRPEKYVTPRTNQGRIPSEDKSRYFLIWTVFGREGSI